MRRRLNKKGVAILLVLTAVAALSVIVTEFAYNIRVNDKIARGELDRIKAYYLAKSALNFMLLELKFDKTFQQAVQQQNLGQYLGQNAQLPLCQQFPMSTGLIRLVFTGGGAGTEDETGATGGGAEPTAEEKAAAEQEKLQREEIEKMQKGTSVSDEKGATEFLQFEGDFEGECVDEGTKINLNGFAGLSQVAPAGGTSSFDQYKLFLFKFLSNPQFDPLFKQADVLVSDVVNNIGDWIDENTDINDMDGRVKGNEDDLYDKLGVSYKPRNGKLISLPEAYLIDGVVDDWFAPLMDGFTVYGDSKINVCTTTRDVIESTIRRYIDSTPSLPPLRLEDQKEMDRLVGAIVNACSSGAMGDALKQAVSNALSQEIGAVSSGAPTTVPQPGQPAQPIQPGQPQAGAPPVAAGAQDTGFAAFITADRRFFSIKLTGQVNETMVRIMTVVDIKDTDPQKWKMVYWRIY